MSGVSDQATRQEDAFMPDLSKNYTAHAVTRESPNGASSNGQHDQSTVNWPVAGSPHAEWALALASIGIPVFPLWGTNGDQCDCGKENCKDAGKHPHPLAEHGHHSATTDPDKIAATWSAAPKANVGVNLKQAGLMIVGPDSPKWLAEFEARGLPETATVQSGGGEGHRHYWYRRPDGCRVMRTCKSGEYDIISDGYAIAPPSTHKSGSTYQFLTLPWSISALPMAPAWAVQMLEDAAADRTDFVPVDPDEPPVDLDGDALARWHGRVMARKDGGDADRSKQLVDIAKDLALAGLTRRGIVDALSNRDRCLWDTPKYAGRTDTDKRYAELADGAFKAAGRVTDVADAAVSGESGGEEGTVTDVADVARVAVSGESGGEEESVGSTLLNDVKTYLKTYVAYPSTHAGIAHTLWIAHTHMMPAWDSTPRLAFLSPEPSSGKTRGLEASNLLVPRAIEAINVSAAYLFRKVDDAAGLPTILFDEIDTIFGPKAKEHEDIRGLINAGHRKGAISGRCVGPNQTPTDFPAYCAVALAGLGDLPDTILTRSVVIAMRRRSSKEKIQPFRQREAEKSGLALQNRLKTWARSVMPTVGKPWPVMPAGIEDRDADVWEALLVVANAAGGEWPELARKAAVYLVNAVKEKPASLGIRFLTDLRVVFKGRDEMGSDEIVDALIKLDEAPWAAIRRGEPINTRYVANKLSGYEVKSTTVRIGPGKKKVVRGFKADDLEDTWDRYLPPLSEGGDTAAAEDVAENETAGESTSSSPPDSPETAASATSATDSAEEIYDPTFDTRSVSFDSFTGGAMNDDSNDDDDY